MFLQGIKNAQDIQEEVDYVQVQIDGRQDMFLWWQLVHQQVCIKNDKPTEEQRSGSSENQLHSVVVDEDLKDRYLDGCWNVDCVAFSDLNNGQVSDWQLTLRKLAMIRIQRPANRLWDISFINTNTNLIYTKK